MADEARLFEAWCVPAWDGGGPDVAVRVLPPARTRAGEPPDVALAVPDLRAAHVESLMRSLRDAREPLLERPVAELVAVLGRVGERFLDDADPLRERALEALAGTSGMSAAMCARVLDGMARDWTAERLDVLVRADFPDPSALDGFVPVERGPAASRSRLRAVGVPVAFHVSAGSVPGVSATSLLRSLLVKTPVLLKPGRGDVALPVLLLRALAEADSAVARAAAVLYWPGGSSGSRALEDSALAGAGLVVAYGGDDTVADLRSRLRAGVSLVVYPHRVSLGVVGREAVAPGRVEPTARAAARAVALFDQRGCVSPHALFVEAPRATKDSVEELVDALAAALAELDRDLPPGRMDDAEASALQQLRGTAEMRAAAGEGVVVRAGGASPWTVVLDPAGDALPTCLNRTVRVVPVDDLAEVPGRIARLGEHLQSVGVAGVGDDRIHELAEAFARVGVLRLAPLEEMPFPPGWWRHDGRGPLEVLVRWVELEGSGGSARP